MLTSYLERKLVVSYIICFPRQIFKQDFKPVFKLVSRFNIYACKYFKSPTLRTHKVKYFH